MDLLSRILFSPSETLALGCAILEATSGSLPPAINPAASPVAF